MTLIKLISLVLLLPTYWWMVTVIPPFATQGFVEHMLEEGEHCDDHCSHPHPIIKQPQESGEPIVCRDETLVLLPLFMALSHSGPTRDRPPPLFYSLSHSLRAPPTLIPA